MKPVLWITPKWPIPANDGARRASYNLLLGLTRLGVPIKLLSFTSLDDTPNLGDAIAQLGIQEACTIQPRFAAHSSAGNKANMACALARHPLLPLTMRYFTQPLESFGSYSAVVYDGLHVAAHAQRYGLFVPPKGNTTPLVYRAHNREALLWERKAQQFTLGGKKSVYSRLLKETFFKYQAQRVLAFEDSLVKHSAFLATVSDADLKLFTLHSSLLAKTVPIGCEFTQFASEPVTPSVLYVGRLDWPPNREGLQWLLEKVWPVAHSRRPQLTLTIIGSGDSSWLAPYLSLPGITFLGKVPTLEEHYERCTLTLVPIFYGSGTRVKAIEASAFGRGILSTAIGVEGLPLVPQQSYFNAETEQEWITVLSNYDPMTSLNYGSQAQRALQDDYSINGAAQHFYNNLCNLKFNSNELPSS
jgi:polysaccharide biosynthesis protein PslH